MARMSRGAKLAAARAGEVRLQRRLKQIEYLTINAVAKSVFETGKEVIELARSYAPVDTGYLRSTAFVDHPKKRGSTYVVNLGFRAHYAAVQEKKVGYLEKATEQVEPLMEVSLRANRQVLATLKPIKVEI